VHLLLNSLLDSVIASQNKKSQGLLRLFVDKQKTEYKVICKLVTRFRVQTPLKTLRLPVLRDRFAATAFAMTGMQTNRAIATPMVDINLVC